MSVPKALYERYQLLNKTALMQRPILEHKEFKKLQAQNADAPRPKRDATVLTDAEITEFETALNNMLPKDDYEQGWLDAVQSMYKTENGKEFLRYLANPKNQLRAFIPFTDGYGVTNGYNLTFWVFVKYDSETGQYRVSRHRVGEEPKQPNKQPNKQTKPRQNKEASKVAEQASEPGQPAKVAEWGTAKDD